MSLDLLSIGIHPTPMWICGTLQGDVGTSRECKPRKREREVAISERGVAQTKILGNPTRNNYKVFNELKFQNIREDAPTTRQLLADMISMSEIRPPSGMVPTLRRLDINSVCQVPLHADDHICEVREMDGSQDIVYDTLFKQNRRVVSKFGVCSKCCGKGGRIVMPLGVRDDISCPSQSKGHGRYSRDEVKEMHESTKYQ